MQVEPFFARNSSVFHNQSECGPGRRVILHGNGVTEDVTGKTICNRCAVLAKSAPEQATKKIKNKKDKKKHKHKNKKKLKIKVH
jgi:hypothetical protein